MPISCSAIQMWFMFIHQTFWSCAQHLWHQNSSWTSNCPAPVWHEDPSRLACYGIQFGDAKVPCVRRPQCCGQIQNKVGVCLCCFHLHFFYQSDVYLHENLVVHYQCRYSILRDLCENLDAIMCKYDSELHLEQPLTPPKCKTIIVYKLVLNHGVAIESNIHRLDQKYVQYTRSSSYLKTPLFLQLLLKKTRKSSDIVERNNKWALNLTQRAITCTTHKSEYPPKALKECPHLKYNIKDNPIHI